MNFIFTADAGSNVQIIVPGAINGTFPGGPGRLKFGGSASAGNATFVCKGGEIDDVDGAVVTFGDHSAAANGRFTLKGGLVSGANGASIVFGNSASLGNATITLEGGVMGSGETSIEVLADTTGSGANLSLLGNSNLYISDHNQPGFALGSLEGDGGIILGVAGGSGRTLVVGNNRSTTFSGVLDDTGSTGSLTKVGNGTLTLTGSNTYLGPTLINQGQLLVNNTAGSGTGERPGASERRQSWRDRDNRRGTDYRDRNRPGSNRRPGRRRK